MAISYVGSAGGTAQGVSTFTITKPSGVTSGDFMIFAVAQYAGASDPKVTVGEPGGWTIVADAFISGSYPHQLTVMTRTAGGSEPSSWGGTFTGDGQFIIAQLCVAYRGVTGLATSTTDTAGYTSSFTVGNVTNSSASNWRVVIGGYSSGTVSYALESDEAVNRIRKGYKNPGSSDAGEGGIWDSNGTVGTGTHWAQLSRDANWSSACGWIGILDANDTTIPGALDVDLRLPTMSVTMTQTVSGTAASQLPFLQMSASGIATPPAGSLTADIVPVVSMTVTTPPLLTLDAVIEPIFDIVGETRKFGTRVIAVEAESRTITPRFGTDTL